jgi:hypothetical protein
LSAPTPAGSEPETSDGKSRAYQLKWFFHRRLSAMETRGRWEWDRKETLVSITSQRKVMAVYEAKECGAWYIDLWM